VRIEINLNNKTSYLLIVFSVLAITTGFVIAFGGSNPQVLGHSGKEITGLFGEWEERDLNEIYNAETDGFVICYGYASDYVIYSDESSEPLTIRARTISGGGAYNYWIMSPIRKGEHWKVTKNGKVGADGTKPTCYWLPVGS